MVDNVEEFREWVDDEPDFGLDEPDSVDDRPEKPKYETAIAH